MKTRQELLADRFFFLVTHNKWYWISRGIGGRSELNYLIKVKGIFITEAVGMVLGLGGRNAARFSS